MKKLLVAILGVLVVLMMSSFAFAGEDIIGEVKGKGFIFKDTFKIYAFDDPYISGITCYTTYASKSLSLSDSSSTSLSCRKTGTIKGKLESRKNVFSRSKNLFFKKTVVDRFYDKKRNVLVYFTYTTATGGDNMSNSISVVVVR